MGKLKFTASAQKACPLSVIGAHGVAKPPRVAKRERKDDEIKLNEA